MSAALALQRELLIAALDRASSSIFPHLAQTGGIRPPERTRSRLALTLSDREEISRGLAADLSLRAIAHGLARAPSTISREWQKRRILVQCNVRGRDIGGYVAELQEKLV